MNSNAPTLKISKLDAAKRQLDCAIKLWFANDDPVAIHTLAYSSHEIIHVLNLKIRGSSPALLDSPHIRPERRAEINLRIKSDGNFFKHADRDPHAVIDFNPTTTEGLMIFTNLGLDSLGERRSDLQSAFNFWNMIHHPDLFNTPTKVFLDSIGVVNMGTLKEIRKEDFLNFFFETRPRVRN